MEVGAVASSGDGSTDGSIAGNRGLNPAPRSQPCPRGTVKSEHAALPAGPFFDGAIAATETKSSEAQRHNSNTTDVAAAAAHSVPLVGPDLHDTTNTERIYLAVPTHHAPVPSATMTQVYSPVSVSTVDGTPGRFPSCVLVEASPTTAPTAGVEERPSNTLHRLPLDAVGHLLSFCDPSALLRVSATSARLRSAVNHTFEALLWRPRCEELWAGKVGFDLRLPAHSARRNAAGASTASSPTAERQQQVLPSAVVAKLARAVTLMSEAPRPVPEGLVVGLAHSWRAAFFLSRADARRDYLVDDELFELDWSVTFRRLRASSMEPAAPPRPVFRRVGRRNVVRASAELPEVPCQLYDGGRRVQVDVFPAHAVHRNTETWGWQIANPFVVFDSHSQSVTTQPATLAAATSQEPSSMTEVRSSLVHIASVAPGELTATSDM